MRCWLDIPAAFVAVTYVARRVVKGMLVSDTARLCMRTRRPKVVDRGVWLLGEERKKNTNPTGASVQIRKKMTKSDVH